MVDLHGYPVPNARVEINTGNVYVGGQRELTITSTKDGFFKSAYLGQQWMSTTVFKSGYLPRTQSGGVIRLHGNDFAANGDFELGSLGWQLNGAITIEKVGNFLGNYSGLGQLIFQANEPVCGAPSSASASQMITTSENLTHATLDFACQYTFGQNSPISLSVIVSDPTPSALQSVTLPLNPIASPPWNRVSIDLPNWHGQPITLTLSFVKDKSDCGMPPLYIDDLLITEWRTPVIYALSPSIFASATVTQAITLSTTNASPSATIRIDDTIIGQSTWLSSTLMTLTLPAGLPIGRHDVWITNPDGQETVLIQGLRIGYEASMPIVFR